MKKTMVLSCMILLMITYICSASAIWYCPYCGTRNADNYRYCPQDGFDHNSYSDNEYKNYNGVWACANQKLATRTGPSTEYTEPGTFQLKDEWIRIVSIAYDVNQIPWVQCEISENGQKMRVYTGLKRFSITDSALNELRVEKSCFETKYICAGTKVYYGPGYDYALMNGYYLYSGQCVYVVSRESGWIQIQFRTTSSQLCRGWIKD